MKKYFKTKQEANEARNTMLKRGFTGIHVFKMLKGTRKHGWFAVCTELEYLNTY